MVNHTGKRRRLLEELFESESEDEEDDYNETDSLEEIDSDEQDRLKPPVQRRPNKERNHLLARAKLATGKDALRQPTDQLQVCKLLLPSPKLNRNGSSYTRAKFAQS
ncbi:hypothetical protein PCANC_21028 [Puccinia coronata f. sp. avenae]|uniref:Uncharacterized protein n=1 Tax=Puccinia coronata f. sp. avenae TaxID=200324 RepID=A0A2N5TWH3_9BASI|nr:hypothetical protein PCANC_21028 [Puccinia coronata f. sp. avenae]